MKVSRIAHEKKTVELMIRLYCRKKEKNKILCTDCEELLRYAHARLDRCPFGEKKGACKECTVHCYKPVLRERMRQVMRFSGPRMLFYAPWQTIRHLLNLITYSKKSVMKKAIIIGATSGIGQEVDKMPVTGRLENRSSRQTAIFSRKPATGSTGSNSNPSIRRNPRGCKRKAESAHRQTRRHGFVSS